MSCEHNLLFVSESVCAQEVLSLFRLYFSRPRIAVDEEASDVRDLSGAHVRQTICPAVAVLNQQCVTSVVQQVGCADLVSLRESCSSV